MNRLKISPSAVIVLAIAIVLAANIVQSAIAISPNDPNFIAIQTALRTYADIKVQAEYTFDDSRFREVLANDPRGGLVDEYFLGMVRYIQGKPNLKLEEIGYLDIIQARYAYCRLAKQLYDEAASRGEIQILPIPTDNAILPTPFDPLDKSISPEMRATDQARRTFVRVPGPEDVPEIQALERATGFSAGLPVPTTVNIRPAGFTLLSVSVVGDLARARVDWDYGLVEDILVKKDGKWYLVGEHILRWHAG